eukprot:7836852-Lingulodinium_polyedra.AAC.1
MLQTAVVDHAAYRECGVRRVHESAPETAGRVVRSFQWNVRPDRWGIGPKSPGHFGPSINYIGRILFTALEDVVPTFFREHLANGIDHSAQ